MSEVWLLEVCNYGEGDSDDDFRPHIIYASQEDLMNMNPFIKWSLIDSDAMNGVYPGVARYYASPWPVHGDN